MDTSPARGLSRVHFVSLKSTRHAALSDSSRAARGVRGVFDCLYFSISTTLSVIQQPASGAAVCLESVNT